MESNLLDNAIVQFLNQFAHRSQILDYTIAQIANGYLFKGGVIMCIFWYLWFNKDPRLEQKRDTMISTILGAFAAMFIARVLVNLLPFRHRPIYNPELHLAQPYGFNPSSFDNLSSFPSDHATLFFALAAGILFVTRTWGTVAMAYVTLFIALPRIYLGLHYPTDILAGATLGITVTYLANTHKIGHTLINRILSLRRHQPQFFYVTLFLITCEIFENFDSSRKLISFILHPLQPC